MMVELNTLLKEGLYIIEGYVRWLFDIFKGEASPRYKQRYKICKECKYNKHGVCKLCGCIIKAKTRVSYELDENGISLDGCPMKKW